MTSWTPLRRFDLITCVHGLRYVGDKPAVIIRAVGALTEQGRSSPIWTCATSACTMIGQPVGT